MGRKQQFFGVKVGRKPGVYTEWSECKAQILGIESAKWKRFSTLEEAKMYCSTDPIKLEISDTKSGTIASPISIDEDDMDTEMHATLPVCTSSDNHLNTKRNRHDTTTITSKENVLNSPRAKFIMQTVMALSPNANNPSASTPTSSPSAKRKELFLDPVNISAITSEDRTTIKDEDEAPLSSDADLTLTDASVVEIENISVATNLSKKSFLPDIRQNNKTVQPAGSRQKQSKKKPKNKHKLVKQHLEPSQKYEELGYSSDEDLEIIENPKRDVQMGQSMSEEFLKVGSREGEVAVGIFWDIENVRLPRGLNPAIFITKLREKFVDESSKFCEKHFYVVCDVKEESYHTMKQLFEFHVRIIHVPRLKANSSDNVIRDLMHEFVGYNKYCRVILISGDSDFSHDIHNFRRNKKCDCVLIHNQNAKESLIKSANSAYLYTDLIKEEIIQHKTTKNHGHPFDKRGSQQYQQQSTLANQFLALPLHKTQSTMNSHFGSYNKGRFYNQEVNINGYHQPSAEQTTSGQTVRDMLDHPLPDYIPLSSPPSSPSNALSKAYYRKKRKELLQRVAGSRKQKSKRKIASNVSLRDY